MLSVIKKPWISEKSTALAEQGKYVFLVELGSKSKQIKDAIEKIYKVNVTRINITRLNTGTKSMKKAIVMLKKGQKIDIIPH